MHPAASYVLSEPHLRQLSNVCHPRVCRFGMLSTRSCTEQPQILSGLKSISSMFLLAEFHVARELLFHIETFALTAYTVSSHRTTSYGHNDKLFKRCLRLAWPTLIGDCQHSCGIFCGCHVTPEGNRSNQIGFL